MTSYAPRCDKQAPVHLSCVPVGYPLGKEVVDGLRRRAIEDHASDRHGMVVLCGIARIVRVEGYRTGRLTPRVQVCVCSMDPSRTTLLSK
jgi:hypothetical protein